MMGSPCCCARTFTGGDFNCFPLPLGLSGWVTIPASVLSLASSSVKEGIAKSGVPIKMMFKEYLFVEVRSKKNISSLNLRGFMW
jgi:hypothetical protein